MDQIAERIGDAMIPILDIIHVLSYVRNVGKAHYDAEQVVLMRRLLMEALSSIEATDNGSRSINLRNMNTFRSMTRHS